MHQHAASSHAYRDGVQNVFEFLRRDRSCVRDWNLDVDDFRCSRNLLAAKRNDGRDTPRIGTRQLHRIFETPEIESFPNLCHWSPGLVDRCMLLVLPTCLRSRAGTDCARRYRSAETYYSKQARAPKVPLPGILSAMGNLSTTKTNQDVNFGRDGLFVLDVWITYP